MIQERKEEFANELRTATEQGDSVKQWRRNFRRDYKQQIEEEGLDFKTFFDEIVVASREDAIRLMASLLFSANSKARLSFSASRVVKSSMILCLSSLPL